MEVLEGTGDSTYKVKPATINSLKQPLLRNWGDKTPNYRTFIRAPIYVDKFPDAEEQEEGSNE